MAYLDPKVRQRMFRPTKADLALAIDRVASAVAHRARIIGSFSSLASKYFQ